jgi:hypothetical protein
MTRYAAFVATIGTMAFLMCIAPSASADVTLDFSGNFGAFTYGNQPGPLNNGSFSGTVTLTSAPGTGSTVNSDTPGETITAHVNLYDSTVQSASNLLFSVDSGTYVTFTQGPSGSGYTQLTISGYGNVGATSVDVATLSLEFSNWTKLTSTGSVIPYGPASNYASSIEYTYLPSTTYFAPVISGQASDPPPAAPEPSTIAVTLVSVLAFVIYGRFKRRPSIA